MKRICLLLLLPLLFLSCTGKAKEDIADAFQAKQYEVVSTKGPAYLHEHFDREVLFEKMIAEYRLGKNEDAVHSAILYAASFAQDNDDNYRSALTIILYFGNTKESLQAGQSLLSYGQSLNLNQITAYYSTLIKVGEEEKANSFFTSVYPQIKSDEALKILIVGNGPSIQIITGLENLYIQTGTTESFLALLKQSLPLIISRGEGESILPLLIKANNPEDYLLDLYIGDIYAFMGYRTRAEGFWRRAQQAYPEMVKTRLFGI